MYVITLDFKDSTTDSLKEKSDKPQIEWLCMVLLDTLRWTWSTYYFCFNSAPPSSTCCNFARLNPAQPQQIFAPLSKELTPHTLEATAGWSYPCSNVNAKIFYVLNDCRLKSRPASLPHLICVIKSEYPVRNTERSENWTCRNPLPLQVQF